MIRGDIMLKEQLLKAFRPLRKVKGDPRQGNRLRISGTTWPAKRLMGTALSRPCNVSDFVNAIANGC
jgi:hypothetical protein